MAADSPHRSDEPLLTPSQGALVGAVAAFPMLAVVFALEPGTGTTARTWVQWLGGMAGQPSLALGLIVHGLIGAVLGALYAMSQQRIPLGTLLGVGAFYGLLLWIGGRILLAWLFSTGAAEVVRSRIWLAGSVSFGLMLALAAGIAGRRR
jgi:hypothetical protein